MLLYYCVWFSVMKERGRCYNIHNTEQCTFVFRHEPPVVGDPFEIVELNESMVVLNKPSSIPVSYCRNLNWSFLL